MDSDTVPLGRVWRTVIAILMIGVIGGLSDEVRVWAASLARPVGMRPAIETLRPDATLSGSRGPTSRPRTTPVDTTTTEVSDGVDAEITALAPGLAGLNATPMTAYNPLHGSTTTDSRPTNTTAATVRRDPSASGQSFADAAFRTPSAVAHPPDGEAGLIQAQREGKLRLATGADLARWKARWMEAHHRTLGVAFDERAMMMRAYVVQGDFEIPSGLTGVHAVVFLLMSDPPPRGDLGHSVLLDLHTGDCTGFSCTTLLQ